MPPDKLKKLQELLSLVSEGLTREEFTQAFKDLVAFVKEVRSQNERQIAEGHNSNRAEIEEMTGELQTALESLAPFKEEFAQAIKEAKEANATTFEAVRKRTVEGLTALFVKMGMNEKLEKALKKYDDRLASFDYDPIQVRTALELTGEDRLDAKYIKNLPKQDRNPIGVHGPLWSLPDVDVTGIVVGQALKWDGIRWIPYTPVGGNSPVYNEAPTRVSGTSWTIAHTPVVGTLRVYGKGQRLPGTEYSNITSTLTTTESWADGEITLDYEY
jgi:hypothetical protein